MKNGNAKNGNARSNPALGRTFPTASALALGLALSGAFAQSAHAGQITVPRVPDTVAVGDDNKPFLVGHAAGTQNYSCLPAGVDAAGNPLFAWTLFTPEATLFNDDLKELITHYFSPNLRPNALETSPKPEFADGPIRATWQHVLDNSTVWAKATGTSTDEAFVKVGAVAWVRLAVVGSEDGPTGGDKLTATTFVQRLNTDGGSAPATGCASFADIGKQAFVPYTADYFFYTKAD
jgi:hypothetical protein